MLKSLKHNTIKSFPVVVSNQTAEEDESHDIALWCKGSTQEFDSCNTGSIPVRAVMGM